MKAPYKTLLLCAALVGAGLSHAAGPGMDHDGKGRMDPARMQARMDKRLDSLKAALKLSPAQEADWTRFSTAMKPDLSAMPQRPSREELDKLSTPERLEKMRSLREQQHKDMSAAMDKRDEAVKAFYASLNAEQKKVFDTQHARIGGMGHDGGPDMPRRDHKAG
ncbi:MAG: Spy/CpxP family protein refolding chaperone [Rhodoferax sp.]